MTLLFNRPSAFNERGEAILEPRYDDLSNHSPEDSDNADSNRDETVYIDGDEYPGGMVSDIHAVMVGNPKRLSNTDMLALIRHQQDVVCLEFPTVLAKVPIGIQKNACFVVDLSKLGHPKDVLSDNNGVWTNSRGVQKVTAIEVISIRAGQTDSQNDIYRVQTCYLYISVFSCARRF